MFVTLQQYGYVHHIATTFLSHLTTWLCSSHCENIMMKDICVTFMMTRYDVSHCENMDMFMTL
jgi:hypothetical protein